MEDGETGCGDDRGAGCVNDGGSCVEGGGTEGVEVGKWNEFVILLARDDVIFHSCLILPD